jgi:prephenate dehydrogenase
VRGKDSVNEGVTRVYERVALIGTGMIGCSLVQALRGAGAVRKVVGHDLSPAAAEKARSIGIVDAVAGSIADAVREAEIVILAVPVRATATVCEALAPVLRTPDVIVTDVGSTKVEVLAQVARILPFPERFVGAHPIAGTERSGPEAADGSLFKGRRCLVTPTAGTRQDALAEVRSLWEAAGATVEEMDPALHDRALAYVSHLPHAAAFALAAAAGEVAGGDDALARAVAGLSGGGFADTTRIAASDPIMWRDVMLDNARPVLDAIERMDRMLGRLRQAIASGDGEAVARVIDDARNGRAAVIGARRST